MKPVLTAITVSAIALTTTPVMAASFNSILTGDQEVPPTGSPATGSAELMLNDEETRLEMNIEISGLDLDGNQTPDNPNDDVVGLHIHSAPAGETGPVVFGLISPESDENNDVTIDPVAGTVSSAWDVDEGNETTLTEQLPNLFNNGLYFNVHTPAFPSGEIRGQIEAVSESVPEPSALMGLAAIASAGLLLRKPKIN